MSDDDDNTVGFKRPPKQHRFEKGKSGNPKGRPKKVKPNAANETDSEILDRLGNEEFQFQGKAMTLRELEIRSLLRKAASGNVQASKHLQSLRREAGLMKASGRGGVLVVPATVPLDEWSAAAARQQAKYRGEDPEGFARLEEAAFGRKPSGQDDEE